MKATIKDTDVIRSWCFKTTLNYARFTFKIKNKRKFIIGEHHRKISQFLDDVLEGKIKKGIINIAPRYGKTEIAVKNFIANGLCQNPKSKFIHLSYSDDLVLDTSKEIQNILLEPEIKHIFGIEPTSTNSKKWYTKEGGGLYAVSSSGQVTGFGAGLVDKIEEDDLEEFFNSEFGGAIIIDDPIKPDDALSQTIREKVNLKFDTTIRNRVNSRNTPIIIIMQRVHEDDLCGYLQKTEPGEWTVLSLPCIQTDSDGNEYPLWEFKHSLDELYKLRDLNGYVFETQYMQNPKPLEGLMYEQGFKTYEIIPKENAIRKAYIDTADEGSDFLCAIIYDETDSANYLIDVLYTQKPMEYTEPKTAELLSKHGVKEAVIESNNGGRGFARAVEKQCRQMGNNKTVIKWFHQSQNKNVRIFTHSAAVQNISYMPKGWDKLFPQFYSAITGYMKTGKNKNDDAPDALTGTIEFRRARSTGSYVIQT